MALIKDSYRIPCKNIVLYVILRNQFAMLIKIITHLVW